jgi:hypothetical protein
MLTAVPSPSQLQPLSLHLSETMSYAEWASAGRQLARLSHGVAWALGDWLIYGQARYGSRYRDALAATQLDYQTLRNYAWVSRSVPLSRRRDTLSFQHPCGGRVAARRGAGAVARQGGAPAVAPQPAAPRARRAPHQGQGGARIWGNRASSRGRAARGALAASRQRVGAGTRGVARAGARHRCRLRPESGFDALARSRRSPAAPNRTAITQTLPEGACGCASVERAPRRALRKRWLDDRSRPG